MQGLKDVRRKSVLASLDSNQQSETLPAAGEDQNRFAKLTVRTYVWIVPNWTLQQSMAISTERRVQETAYQSKL